MTPRQIESTTNVALAALLQPMLPGCVVRSEQTQTIVDHPGRHPDVLITAPGRSPVVIEAEYDPGANPEADAQPRLGVSINTEIRPVEAAVALRYPETVATAPGSSPPPWPTPGSITASAMKMAAAFPNPAGWRAASPTWRT